MINLVPKEKNAWLVTQKVKNDPLLLCVPFCSLDSPHKSNATVIKYFTIFLQNVDMANLFVQIICSIPYVPFYILPVTTYHINVA